MRGSRIAPERGDFPESVHRANIVLAQRLDLVPPAQRYIKCFARSQFDDLPVAQCLRQFWIGVKVWLVYVNLAEVGRQTAMRHGKGVESFLDGRWEK